MNRKLVSIALSSVAAMSVGACQSDEMDDQERLQALLADEPLTQVPPSAEVASASRESDGDAAVAADIHSDVILAGTNPLGVWNFDDCTPSRTKLFDASFNDTPRFVRSA
jgi:hypothetical protein